MPCFAMGTRKRPLPQAISRIFFEVVPMIDSANSTSSVSLSLRSYISAFHFEIIAFSLNIFFQSAVERLKHAKKKITWYPN